MGGSTDPSGQSKTRVLCPACLGVRPVSSAGGSHPIKAGSGSRRRQGKQGRKRVQRSFQLSKGSPRQAVPSDPVWPRRPMRSLHPPWLFLPWNDVVGHGPSWATQSHPRATRRRSPKTVSSTTATWQSRIPSCPTPPANLSPPLPGVVDGTFVERRWQPSTAALHDANMSSDTPEEVPASLRSLAMAAPRPGQAMHPPSRPLPPRRARIGITVACEPCRKRKSRVR